ncbi:universal stress protein [Achromobacter xylosoxidans]|jgi:nucleotide-binding universal stress UspA family protein|uniref:universal stress protein n=1 Tax=Alcaligenes xylosoxydans xylosoxydans TaxID=85698 RepID=UPI0005DA2C78|nr:universal stress protein [Achromobacter xylosoxidans]MDH0519524.1 universal stress protein [Achromobacter xylosoxidans]MDH0543654.1 universal stress protein [Achromobacter xylosoxidans]QKQ54423.1 universal stress protein [Achromobacter xylosoxidans]QPR96423.1 universal stress protein [Achromobacter xylosoxidans]UON40364.1 universal stress protein [Achromobacter xylosoxidans]
MSKILACLDASPYAASVCDLSAWVAPRLSWGVELLHVVQRKSAVTARHDLSGAIGLGVKSELLEELTRIEEAQGKLAVEGGRALLAGAEARLRAAGVDDVSTVHLHGGIVETIIEREAEAGLVVMGKRGASSAFAAGHLGSKIERVLRASNKPLLVAPEQFVAPTQAVIAYDGGKSIARAIALLTSTPLLDRLPIHLVRAGAETQEHRDQMEQAVKLFEQSGRAATFSLTSGSPERVIADCVAGAPTSVLVMGAYGHSPLRNLIVGSTTTSMIRAVEAPILLVR